MKLSVGCVLVVCAIASAADVKTREIIFYDAKTKKDEPIKDAVIQEQNAGGIKIKPRVGAVRQIAAEDIRFIDFENEKVDPLTWRKPYGEEVGGQRAMKETERLGRYQEALKAIADLESKAAGNPDAVRYLAYKDASIKFQISRIDPMQTDAALEALTKFKTDYTEGWAIGMVLKMLAELQREKGDFKAVEKTYADLAALPGCPPEVRWECDMQVAMVMMESDRAAAAETKLKSLVASLPQDHPYREKVSIGLLRCQMAGPNAAQAEKSLRAYVTTAKDPAVKGMVHNTLGDYYQKTNKLEEAFWEYLKVDAMYSEDKGEHAKALYHLSNLFRTVKKNPERADACKEALKDKRYDGSEYQKKAREQK